MVIIQIIQETFVIYNFACLFCIGLFVLMFFNKMAFLSQTTTNKGHSTHQKISPSVKITPHPKVLKAKKLSQKPKKTNALII